MHGAGVRAFQHSPEHEDPARKLRIGFVSADFYDHPVRFFIAPILRGLDREQFSVVCYYNSSYNDFATEQLRALPDEWRPCLTLKDDQLAERIRGDGIDILVISPDTLQVIAFLCSCASPLPCRLRISAIPTRRACRRWTTGSRTGFSSFRHTASCQRTNLAPAAPSDHL